LEPVLVAPASRDFKAGDGSDGNAARERAVVPAIAARERVVAEEEQARIAERPDAHVEHAVDVPLREAEARDEPGAEIAVRAADAAEAEIVVVVERALARAGEAEAHTAVVAARSAPGADLPVGDMVGLAADQGVVAPDRHAEPLAEGEAPVVHRVRPHALVRPVEVELALLEDAPLRGIEDRADGAVVGARRLGEDVGFVDVGREAIPREGRGGEGRNERGCEKGRGPASVRAHVPATFFCSFQRA
jgi:hypothetical protein